MSKNYGVKCGEMYVKEVYKEDDSFLFMMLGEAIKLFTIEEARHVAKFCGGQVVDKPTEPIDRKCPYYPRWFGRKGGSFPSGLGGGR